MIGSIQKRDRKNYKLPITSPVYYENRQLPMDPYLLGVLIGDGGMTSTNTILTSIDLEILENVNKIIDPLGLTLKKVNTFYDRNDYMLSIKDKEVTKNNIVTKITGELGIRCKSEFKFIPEQYLFSSIDDRISLLQGLMDTDGTVCKKSGCPSYSTSSIKLRDNFCELVRSLGGIAT